MQIIHTSQWKTFEVVLFMEYLKASFMKLLLENFCGNYVANP